MNIFPSLHTSVLPSLSPSFSSQLGSEFVLRGHTTGSPRTPWEKCRSAVQCEGLFGYQTSSSNLHGVNLNIAVSCRLPHSPKRARERREKRALEYSSYALKSITFSGGTWPCHCQKKRPLNSRVVGGKRKFEQVSACQGTSILLTNIQFFQILKTTLWAVSGPGEGSKGRISQAWIYLLQIGRAHV